MFIQFRCFGTNEDRTILATFFDIQWIQPILYDKEGVIDVKLPKKGELETYCGSGPKP